MGLSLFLPRYICCQIVEFAPPKSSAIKTAIDRVTATLLHTNQFLNALVEFMVADRVEIKTDQVESLDGRLIMEQRRKQGAGADHITGGDHHRVRVGRTQGIDVRSKIFRAASVDRTNSSEEPAGGSRLPWKSFNAKIWTFTVPDGFATAGVSMTADNKARTRTSASNVFCFIWVSPCEIDWDYVFTVFSNIKFTEPPGLTRRLPRIKNLRQSGGLCEIHDFASPPRGGFAISDCY